MTNNTTSYSTYKTKIRALSVFLVFLILSLTFMQVLSGTMMKVKGARIGANTASSSYMNGKTGSTQHSGKSVSRTDGGTFSYTYKKGVKPSKVTMFDYLTDDEIAGGDPNSKIENGRANPFKKFNYEVSHSALVLDSDSPYNITFIYKPMRQGVTSANIHLFNNSTGTQWPGYAMTYYPSTNEYKLTMKFADIKNSSNTAFVPNSFIINGHDERSESSVLFQTENVVLGSSMQAGKAYEFIDYTETAGTANRVTVRLLKTAGRILLLGGEKNNAGNHLCDDTTSVYAYISDGMTDGDYAMTSNGNYWEVTIDTSAYSDDLKIDFWSTRFYAGAYGINDKRDVPNKGRTDIFLIKNGCNYVFANDNTDSSGTAEQIYVRGGCEYPYPLYFGDFYEGDSASDYYGYIPLGPVTNNKPKDHNGDYLNNFYWQANLGLRGNYDASAQELVDNTLTNGLAQDGKELPYFNIGWAEEHNDVMRYYETDSEGQDIVFPFYEIWADASTVKGTGRSGYNARFYQFNSMDSNLYFDGDAFEETNTPISGYSNSGFFPFNIADTSGNKNNCGFGAKFEMKFKLTGDGTVSALDSNGVPDENAGKVHTMFEFYGDDDLWVFLDGNLLLDMGGAHSQSSGLIDFADRKVTVNDAFVFNKNITPDNLNALTTSKTILPITFISKIEGNNTLLAYDTNYVHTITIFYMERGMLDSNLMVRFNYTPEANFSKMKIREETDFSGVNAGLRALTGYAAENDVFKYTVLNKGTKVGDILDTGVLYPTYETNTRTNDTISSSPITTRLTGQDYIYETYSDADAVFLDGGGLWETDDAIIGAWVWKGNGAGRYYRAEKLIVNGEEVSGVYKLSGFPSDADSIIWMRHNPLNLPVIGTINWPSAGLWARTEGNAVLTKGAVYTITSWGTPSNGVLRSTYTLTQNYEYQYIHYETNNFAPGSDITRFYPVVSDNTGANYLWVDASAGMIHGTKGTGKTDSTGSLYLMYGTDTLESSAEFERQFRRDSTMNVTQSPYLYSPVRAVNAPVTFVESDRRQTGQQHTNVSDYYVVNAPVVKDLDSNTIPFTVGSNNTEYTFNNDQQVDAGRSVMLTETFRNSPKTGSISITKEIEPEETNNTTLANAEFTFRLRLTDIFDVQGVNVINSGTGTGYEAIEVTRYYANETPYTSYSMTNTTVSGTDYGLFSLKAGEKLTIEDIPVGTEFEIAEVSDANSYYGFDKAYIKSSGSWSQLGGTTITGEVVYDTEKEYKVRNKRKTGDLTLSKSLSGNTNAQTTVNNSTPFTLRVTLTAPDGVDLTDYITDPPEREPATAPYNTSGRTYTSSSCVYDFTVLPGASNTVTLKGIPYGTKYEVEELTTGDTNHPSVYVEYNQNDNREIKNPSTVATVTNTYRKITLTKVDANDNTVGLKDAVFYLFKLKSGIDQTNAAAKAAFEGAADYSDFMTNYYSLYCDDASGALTTNASGVIVVNDSMMTNGLTDGKYFFFEETPPDGYKKDNSFTAAKIVTIAYAANETTEYTVQYENEKDIGVTVIKEDNRGNRINEQAEFELYYRETVTTTQGNSGNPGNETTTVTDTLLATVVTGANGEQIYIKALKLDAAQTEVDTEYLDHTTADIGAAAAVKKVKIVKDGTYYWKESVAPQGYEIDTTEHIFTLTSSVFDPVGSETTVIQDTPIPSQTGEVILTKRAKERAGDVNIGDTLSGAQFKLIAIDGNTEDDSLRFTRDNGTGVYTLGSASDTYNASGNWLVTGSDGKIRVVGLDTGDYCFEEQTAPANFTAADSGTGANKRVYFSVGSNTQSKEVVCTDEMAPAYIRIIEHIDDYKPDGWGSPTFIFKITQTKNADNTDVSRNLTVSLTFDNSGDITDTVRYYNNGTAVYYTEDTVDPQIYDDWLVESTADPEYEGIFRIDSRGRIRVEPGEYQITRVPVSRYEFVASGHKVYTTDTDPGSTLPTADVNSTGTEAPETVVLTAGQTGDIHYYDTLSYYDKYSQTDTEVNSFYTLNGSKENTTIKDIRIADYHQDSANDTQSDTLTIQVGDLDITKVFVNGTEAPMKSQEKSGLTNITVSYVFSAGDADSFGGSDTAVPPVAADFSYDPAAKTITVDNASAYADGVYTLEADYKGYKARFDIVFERT